MQLGHTLADFLARANRNINVADFGSASAPLTVLRQCYVKPDIDRQYILRMMLRSDVHALTIPKELEWLKATIHNLDRLQKVFRLANPFIYVTVRHGVCDSASDDQWHVDGFSTRMPHLPEQNYVCTSSGSTEHLIKSWQIPTDFDPNVHNIHMFFQENAADGRIVRSRPYDINLVDPYCVHRRDPSTAGTVRTFWRVSFVPIEIEDDACTPNPLLPANHYNRRDTIKRFVRYSAS